MEFQLYTAYCIDFYGCNHTYYVIGYVFFVHSLIHLWKIVFDVFYTSFSILGLPMFAGRDFNRLPTVSFAEPRCKCTKRITLTWNVTSLSVTYYVFLRKCRLLNVGQEVCHLEERRSTWFVWFCLCLMTRRRKTEEVEDIDGPAWCGTK